jgi:hypothetical protein
MALEMVDREIRFAKADRQALGDGRTNHERTRESGAAGRRKSIDFPQIDLCRAYSAIEQPRRVDQMIARGDLRHDPAELLMRGDLRGDFAGKQFMPVIAASAQDRNGGLIAGSLKCQDGCHNLILGQALRLPNRGQPRRSPYNLKRPWLLLYRFSFRRALLRVSHDALQRVDRAQHLGILSLDNLCFVLRFDISRTA